MNRIRHLDKRRLGDHDLAGEPLEEMKSGPEDPFINGSTLPLGGSPFMYVRSIHSSCEGDCGSSKFKRKA